MLALAIHIGLLVAILVGVAVRHRVQAAVGFVAYLIVTLASKLAHATDRITPADWFPYLLEQVAQALLALGVAVEIGGRIFHKRAAPAGRAYVARAMLALLVLGLVAAVAWGLQLRDARTDGDVYDALLDVERRVSGAAMWVFVAVFGIAELRYHWPIDPYHRDIAIGFGVYRAAFFALSPGPEMPMQLPAVWPVWLYTAVLLLWLRAAWRRDDFSHIDVRFRRLVFPWARHTS